MHAIFFKFVQASHFSQLTWEQNLVSGKRHVSAIGTVSCKVNASLVFHCSLGGTKTENCLFLGPFVEIFDPCFDPVLDVPIFDVGWFCHCFAVPVCHNGMVVDTDVFLCEVGKLGWVSCQTMGHRCEPPVFCLLGWFHLHLCRASGSGGCILGHLCFHGCSCGLSSWSFLLGIARPVILALLSMVGASDEGLGGL